MVPCTKPLILLALVTTLFVMLKGGEALKLIPDKVTVQINNNFQPAQDLTLHCKSKDDDLGEHTIKGGENYEFTFRPNALAVITQFFCSFKWPSQPSLHYFDVYIQERDENVCTLCSWKIWEEGACRFDPNKQTVTECLPWNSAPSDTNASSVTQSHL